VSYDATGWAWFSIIEADFYLKNEILGKPVGISFDLLVQSLGWHSIDRGEIGIQDHFLVSDGENECLQGPLHEGKIPDEEPELKRRRPFGAAAFLLKD
jgi:hypothetical protein